MKFIANTFNYTALEATFLNLTSYKINIRSQEFTIRQQKDDGRKCGIKLFVKIVVSCDKEINFSQIDPNVRYIFIKVLKYLNGPVRKKFYRLAEKAEIITIIINICR